MEIYSLVVRMPDDSALIIHSLSTVEAAGMLDLMVGHGMEAYAFRQVGIVDLEGFQKVIASPNN